MISEKIKNEFLKNETGMIRVKEKNEKQVVLLREALRTEQFTDEEIGWAYWNISDNLALLRKSEEQYENHRLFEKHILNMDKKYLHWLTSDNTQTKALYVGGYEQFWNGLYKYACEKSPKSADNRRIRYESHRAAATSGVLRENSINENISRFAFENMKTMLDSELLSDYNYNFYRITYFTLFIHMNVQMKVETDDKILDESYLTVIPLFEYLQSDRNEPDKNTMYFLGSWDSFKSDRSKFNQATVGIKNYIIALINAGEYAIALEYYEKIKPYNLEYNNYFKSKIELAEINGRGK
jgi:hypothetical protein